MDDVCGAFNLFVQAGSSHISDFAFFHAVLVAADIRAGGSGLMLALLACCHHAVHLIATPSHRVNRSTATVAWKPWERVTGVGDYVATTAVDAQPWRLVEGQPAKVRLPPGQCQNVCIVRNTMVPLRDVVDTISRACRKLKRGRRSNVPTECTGMSYCCCVYLVESPTMCV